MSVGQTSVGVVAIVLMACVVAAGQVSTTGQVIPVDLVAPVYPAIAIQARVSGEVTLVVHVRPDGTVANIEPVNGLPLLTEAAVHAATNSRFECLGCDGVTGSFTITYTFSFEFDHPPVRPEFPDASHARIHVTAEPPTSAPYFSYRSARSATCLYLWRCGLVWGGMDVYYYSVRSGRCAWLWKCGWHRRQPSRSSPTL